MFICFYVYALYDPIHCMMHAKCGYQLYLIELIPIILRSVVAGIVIV